jgi:hypothetical protein
MILTSKQRQMVADVAAGTAWAAGIATFVKLSKKSKGKFLVPALAAGGVVTGFWLVFRYALRALEPAYAGSLEAYDAQLKEYAASKGMSGMGLVNVQRTGLIDAQRVGLYTPEPSVRKFNRDAGTRYYS